VGFDIGGDEFVFGKHNFLTVWALKVESGRDYRISNRVVSQGAGTAGIGRFLPIISSPQMKRYG